MTRQEANYRILELIAAEVEKYPDARLNQIIVNLGISKSTIVKDEWDALFDLDELRFNHVDYYEEPMITLERIN
jgi:hypothetical protein